jgi:hypothetical protein
MTCVTAGGVFDPQGLDLIRLDRDFKDARNRRQRA